MIQNFKTGKGFRGASEYVSGKEGAKRLSCGTMQGQSPRALAKEAGAFRAMRPNMKTAVVHISLNLHQYEGLSSDQWADIAQEYMKGMGMNDCPWYAERHHDTNHDHIHIVGVRIDSDGKAVSDSHVYRRGAKICQKLEVKYGLTQSAKTPEQAWEMDERATKNGEMQNFRRTGEVSEKEIIKSAVKEIFKNGGVETAIFFEQLHAAGIIPRPYIKAGKMTGISYEKNGIAVKGSSLGKSFSPKGLEKLGLDYDQDRDFPYLQNYLEDLKNEHKRSDARSNEDQNDTNTPANGRRQGLAAERSKSDRSSFTENEADNRAEDRRNSRNDRADGSSNDTNTREYPGDRQKISIGAGEASQDNDKKNTNSDRGDREQSGRAGGSGTELNQCNEPSNSSSLEDRTEQHRTKTEVLDFVSTPGIDNGYSSGDRIMDLAYKPSHIIAKEKSWSRQADALGAPEYRITLTDGKGKAKPWNMGKGRGPDGGEKFFTAQEVKDLITTILSAKNAQGRNIYVTPIDDQNHYILLDDSNADKIKKLQVTGFKPAFVQESSPNNIQAIFKVPKPEVSKFEQSVGNTVTQRLNKELGDPKLSGTIHPFRMSGFANRKPKYEKNGKYPFVKIIADQGGICQKMTTVMEQTRADKKAERDEIAQSKATEVAQERKKRIANIGRTYEPQGIDKDLSNVEFRFCQARHKWENLAKAKGWSLDDSRLDFRAAKDIVMTYGQEKTAAAIKSCSPAIGERHKDIDDYANRTAANAEIKVQQEQNQVPEEEPENGMKM